MLDWQYFFNYYLLNDSDIHVIDSSWFLYLLWIASYLGNGHIDHRFAADTDCKLVVSSSVKSKPNNLHCEDKLFDHMQFITHIVDTFHEATFYEEFRIVDTADL